MGELVRDYILIFTSSMFKFIFGPVIGIKEGLSLLETVSFTVFGMMTTVFILTFLGTEARKQLIARFSRNRKLFTKRNRRIVVVWRKYGAFGVSFLTPVFFSPIVGTIIVVSFGEKKRKILFYMLFSSVFWGLILTMAGQQLINVLERFQII